MATFPRSVQLTARLTENEEPLPGSRAWVAKVIEESTVVITTTRQSEPAVFLVHPTGFGEKGRERKTQLLALFGEIVEWYGRDGKGVDSWPFQDGPGEPCLFGLILTAAGLKLAGQFAHKCKTLLRWKLRREDQPTGKLKVSLS